MLKNFYEIKNVKSRFLSEKKVYSKGHEGLLRRVPWDKIIFLCLLTSIFRPQTSFSQTAPAIEWQNTIGGANYDELQSMQQTSDGGYILGGLSKSNISGDKTENCIGLNDYWLIKTDGSGNIQWQNTIGGSDDDQLFAIQQTADDGFILGGYSRSNISGDKTENNYAGSTDYWIVKTDVSGNIQWQNTIGGDNDDLLYAIRQTTDGGYILGGWSDSNISGDKTENSYGDKDYWMVKTDGSGNIQWQKTMGGSEEEKPNTIQQTTDGGYIIGGYSLSDSSGNKTENNNGVIDGWIVKTDASGNIQWQNTIGGSLNDFVAYIQQTNDGGYILGATSYSNISGDKTENSMGHQDYWLVKTDISGNIQWQNTIGGDIVDALLFVRQTSDSGYILGGISNSNISGDKTESNIGLRDYWIVKTDAAGNVQWENTIGGTNNDDIRVIYQLSNGGYIAGGYSASNISGDKTENTNGADDYWIMKFGPDTITAISNLRSSISNLQFFPNPLTIQSKLTFKNPNKEKFLFILYDITGRITESVSTISSEIILTKGSKQPGVYLFNLMNERTGESVNGKIVITD